MKILKKLIKKQLPAYIIALIAMILSVCLDLLSPQLTKIIVDDVILGGKEEILMYLLLGIFICGLGRFAFQYIKEFTFDKVGCVVSGDLRKDLFRHIQSLSISFHEKNNTGELMARVKDDVDRIWDALGFVAMLSIEVVIHTAIVLFCMFKLHPLLAIFPTICMILCAFIAIRMESKLHVVYGEISEENALLNNVAEENLTGVRTVKAFAREKFEIEKFLSHNKQYYELNMKQSKVFIKYYPYLQVITKVLPIAMVLLGGYVVIQGDLTLGSLTALVQYSTNIVWPMEMLGWLSKCLSAAFASAKKLNKIYNETSSIKESDFPVVLDQVRGEITFDHVSFHKEDNYPILKDISFHVEPGKTIGIMGTTGAGKTSIVSVLQRLYDVTDGTVYLDGVDIKELSLSQLRKSISSVMQDVFLFSDTISENIRLGGSGLVDIQTIKQASYKAQAKEFIEEMDEQYETIIGERGVGLSGGQKQRISIARALAKKAPILVLDDSTSALDMETEHEIQQVLRELDNTTKIIIAHRISAVRNADEIIILEDGKIKERGTHETLLNNKGLYYTTYISQYGEIMEQKEVAAWQ